MWRKHKAKEMEPERRPTDEALLEALRLNHDHVRGITRLDQQLVYVPLGALAAAIYAVGSWPARPTLTDVGHGVLAFTFALIAGVVAWGLVRNQQRHRELLDYRCLLACRLELPQEPTRRDPLRHGRLIYFALFLIGWVLGALVLLHLLTPTQ